MTSKIKINPAISELLYRLNIGSSIELDLLETAFDAILSNNENEKLRDLQLGSVLMGLMVRGPRADEVQVLIKSAFKLDSFVPNKKIVRLPRGAKLVGAIGSGKKGFKTMNISTPAALIAASVGAYTAKAVSSATSSVTGSADLLRELGVNLKISTEKLINVIKEVRFGAFSIEGIIPKFDKIYGQKFYAPNPLSFGLPALAWPIKYDTILYGIAHPNVELSINVLKKFNITNALVVSTTDDGVHYLDEMGVYGTTKMIGMQNANTGQILYFNPLKELGLQHYTHKDIEEGKSIYENVKACVDVLRGNAPKSREDIICINAGTILYLAGIASELQEGYKIAKEAIKDKLPFKKLLEFIDATGGNSSLVNKYIK